MSLSLSWDLFVATFIALVVAYSFIIGKNESLKVIVATYIAIVTVQGIESILLRSAPYLSESLRNLHIAVTPLSIAIGKLTIFIVAVVILTLRGGLAVAHEGELGSVLGTITTGVLGIAKAGLLLTTLVTYVSGIPLFMHTTAPPHSWIAPLLEQSIILRLMLEQRDLWFAIPAILLVIIDLLSKE